jgi:hypothetical protein
LEVVGAGYAAIGKSFIERTVVAKTGRDVTPFGEQRCVGSTTSEVAADGHRAERAAVIALAARNDPIARGLAGLKMKLASELDGGFGGFRAAGGEIDAATVLKVGRSERQ